MHIPFTEKRNTSLQSRFDSLCKKFLGKDPSLFTIVSDEHKAYAIATIEFLRFYKRQFPDIFAKIKNDIQKETSTSLEGFIIHYLLKNPKLRQELEELFDQHKTTLYTSEYSTRDKKLSTTNLLKLIGFTFTELTKLFYLPRIDSLELWKLESLLVVKWQLKIKFGLTKRPRYIFPPYYRKVFKEIYRQKRILLALAKAKSSKKKAKKYMRILQKRIGFYTKKKKPFKEYK